VRIVDMRAAPYDLTGTRLDPTGEPWTAIKIETPEGKQEYVTHQRAFAERAAGTELLLCGDLNVALEERDVHPILRKPNQIGTTEEERALLRQLLAQDLTDLLRTFDKDNDRLFTWWAPWRNFRQRNYGWRIDYVLATPALAARARSCRSVRDFGTSDHGPLLAELAPA
jgi:exodeoxyribonuclease-3